MTIKTRFAPSPTGVLHLGSIRTALFCWLYAKNRQGSYLLRIEDTDRERSTDENVEAIFQGLEWLGLTADEDAVFQTHRLDRYAEIIEGWLESGVAYQCYCTKDELEEMRAAQLEKGQKTRYDGRCRERTEPRPGVDPVVRFKNPLDGAVTVDDAVRGKVTFNNEELDDLIIARSDGMPTYNFTVVVDDSDMSVSHVIRGDDHLNNTPKQINMLKALGADLPAYAHLPMILGPDGAKLSKRHGAVDIREYREAGYLPEAMLNYLVRLGWSHGDQEIFTVDEMIASFDIADVNHAASSFNPDKLRWINQQHIISGDPARIGEALTPFLQRAGYSLEAGPAPADVARVFRERAETLVQMAESASYCFEDFEAIDAKAAKKNLRPVIMEPLQDARDQLSALNDWQPVAIEAAINAVAESHGINMGKLGQPIRVAVTGGAVSPPIDETLWLIGSRRSIERLDRALELVRERAADAT